MILVHVRNARCFPYYRVPRKLDKHCAGPTPARLVHATPVFMSCMPVRCIYLACREFCVGYLAVRRHCTRLDADSTLLAPHISNAPQTVPQGCASDANYALSRPLGPKLCTNA